MQINISKGAWHVRIYQWYFDTSWLPKSLCPYFWAWVLMLPTLPIVGILSLPVYMFTLAYSLWTQKKEDYSSPWIAAISSTIALLGTLILIRGTTGFIHYFRGIRLREDDTFFMVFESIIVSLALFILIGTNVKKWRKRTIYNDYNIWYREIGRSLEYNNSFDWVCWVRVNKPTTTWELIGQGVTSVYKKACPIIHWRQ